MKKWCIAALSAPSKENWSAFVEAVRKHFPSIKGMSLQGGHGAWNIGIVSDDEAEVERLTLVLMPSRYTSVPENDPGVAEDDWSDRRE